MTSYQGQEPGTLRSRLLLPLLYAALALAATGAAWTLANQWQMADLRDRAAERLLLKRDNVVAMVDRYRYLPAVVAKDERIRRLLEIPGDQALVDAANRYLETVNGLAGSDVLFLLDATGTALASSNWIDPKDSFVGKHYGFRPYFKDAIAQGSGRYYAKGVTTGKAGYFLASRIGTAEKPAGVAVVKVDMSSLEKAWTAAGDRAALVDHAGMVFLSSVGEWRLTPLFPLSDEDRRRILDDQQYDPQSLERVPLLKARPAPGQDIDLPVQGRSLPVLTLDIGSEGWQILAAYDAADVRLWAGLAALAVFLAAALLIAVGFYLRERGQRIQADGLRAILENMSVGIAVFDSNLHLLAWNEKYGLLNRYPDGLVRAGRPLAEIIRYNIERGDFGAVDPEKELQKRLDQAREPAAQQIELRRPDGTWVEIRRSRMPGGRFIRIYSDITERKRTEAALAEYKASLERLVEQRTAELVLANERLQVAVTQTEAEKRRVEKASRDKTTLLDAVNHDIRNPLNIILGAARLVMANAKDKLPPLQYANLEKIDAKGRELMELVEDLLDYTRADRVNVTLFRLPPIIERCLSAIELTIAAEGVKIVSDVPADLPELAQDERKLRRIVINLMDNAAKFTETGTIRVGVARRDRTIEIAVADTGRGIAAEDIERIFDEGEQIEQGGRRSKRGIGLGLAICRRFAGLMGGEIAVRSRLGEGSVFTLSLPIIHPTAGADAARATVLVVDDSKGVSL